MGVSRPGAAICGSPVRTKVANIAGWPRILAMRDESLVDNHRFGPTTHLLGNHEDLKCIAAVDPKLALEYELQIYIDKGKFLTIKDRRRMNELLELTKS
jgi:hypothetical protein